MTVDAKPSRTEGCGGPSDALRLTSLPSPSGPSFPLTHLYLEIVYGPILGPAAVLVARNLGRRLTAAGGPVTVSVVAVALELGLRASHDEPLGRRSHLRHGIDRLEHSHLVSWLADDYLGVQTHVPVANDRTVAKLPASAARAHLHFLKTLQPDERGRPV